MTGGRLVGRFLRLVPRNKLISPVASYNVLSSHTKKIQLSSRLCSSPAEAQVENASLQSHRLKHSRRNILTRTKYLVGSLYEQCSRQESCARLLHLLSRPLDCSFNSRRYCSFCPIHTPHDHCFRTIRAIPSYSMIDDPKLRGTCVGMWWSMWGSCRLERCRGRQIKRSYIIFYMRARYNRLPKGGVYLRIKEPKGNIKLDPLRTKPTHIYSVNSFTLQVTIHRVHSKALVIVCMALED